MSTSRALAILRVLLDTSEPTPVTELATRLGVSRRTVFRELDEIDRVLAPYQLNLGSLPGRGVFLAGPPGQRRRLGQDLSVAPQREVDRRARLPQLALLLVSDPGTSRKLSDYALSLHVSQATLGHDLARLDPVLRRLRVAAVRRKGHGVTCLGEESARRRVIAWAWRELETLGRPVDLPVVALPREVWAGQEITKESLRYVERYLAIAWQRLRSGHLVEAASSDPVHLHLALSLAAALQAGCGVDLPRAEIAALSVVLAGCRPVAPRKTQPLLAHECRAKAITMIETFDPRRAPLLKIDEELVNGLAAELAPALVRIEGGIELSDPLADQLAVNYPEIVSRTARALRAILPDGTPLPEPEITIFAAHFGAAVHRLRKNVRIARRLRLGVVCLSGIGTSYLLAAQLKQHFDAVARVEINDNAIDDPSYDLLVSTVPVSATRTPVVQVAPVLDAESLALIRRQLTAILAGERDRPVSSTASSARADDFARLSADLGQLAGQIGELITRFASLSAPHDAGLEDLAKLCDDRFTTQGSHGTVYQDLMDRERCSTQVLPELGIAFLHSRTDAVAAPVLAMLIPTAQRFSSPSLRQVSAAIVMLIPADAQLVVADLMGAVSTALILRDGFLQAIKDHRSDLARSHIAEITRGFLATFIRQYVTD